MNVFIIGITGGVGTLLAQALRTRGDEVRGLVRRDPQRAALAAEGIDAVIGDIAHMSVEQLASSIGGADVAETLAALIHEPRIRRQILELDTGDVEIVEAVRHNVP